MDTYTCAARSSSQTFIENRWTLKSLRTRRVSHRSPANHHHTVTVSTHRFRFITFYSDLWESPLIAQEKYTLCLSIRKNSFIVSWIFLPASASRVYNNKIVPISLPRKLNLLLINTVSRYRTLKQLFSLLYSNNLSFWFNFKTSEKFCVTLSARFLSATWYIMPNKTMNVERTVNGFSCLCVSF